MKIKNVYKIRKRKIQGHEMHIICTVLIFLHNNTHWNNHPSVFSLWKDDHDDGGGDGDETCISSLSGSGWSYETLQVLST